MKKIILYSAQSLNGKIARSDGSVDWLETIPHVEGEDYGYATFYESIGITIQGYSTYQQIIDWGIEFPYKDKQNFVLTRNNQRQPSTFVNFITNDHLDAVKRLKEKANKDIWLIGGGQINTMMLKAGLLDEMIIHTMPIIIPGGIGLFAGEPVEKQMQVMSTKKYGSGVIETHYAVKN
ncbi:MAG: dihydrofolate reductase [Cyclobacteriaceae bacterium]|jgi:dihydrofolate reductase